MLTSVATMIMAGGQDERLWPLSTPEKPKRFTFDRVQEARAVMERRVRGGMMREGDDPCGATATVHHSHPSPMTMAPYAAELGGYRILDYHDAISMHYQAAQDSAKGFWKLFYMLEKERLLHYELEMLRRFDKAFIVSSIDKEYLLTNLRLSNPAATYCPIVVIPMGVKEEVLKRRPNTQPEENQIVFLGKMNYYPNEDAAIYFSEEILPLVKEKIRDLEFIVVGACPTKRVLELEKIKGIKVTGFVEDLMNI